MDAKVLDAGGFDVVGIKTRTLNRDEMGPNGKIPKLWQEFYASQVLGRIPNRADHKVVVLYYDYESDKDGQYTYLIGARVPSAGTVPEGMTTKHVPAGKYAVFSSEAGPVPKIVVETWMRIWAVTADQPGGNRSYLVDYEVYDEKIMNSDRSHVDVFVGVK